MGVDLLCVAILFRRERHETHGYHDSDNLYYRIDSPFVFNPARI